MTSPKSGACNSVGAGCKAPPNAAGCRTHAKCFACGLFVCTNPDCSKPVDYYKYGKRRLCNSCQDDYQRFPFRKRRRPHR
jgi:hypothetical protein